jgi:hypothetical protein
LLNCGRRPRSAGAKRWSLLTYRRLKCSTPVWPAKVTSNECPSGATVAPRMPRAPQPLRSNSGSLAILAAMRRASSGQPGASPNPAGLILRDLGGRSRRTVSVLTRALGFNRLIGLCGRGYLATYEILPKPLHGLCPSRLLLSSFDVL